MRLSVFASGSKGNSLAVQGGSTTLVVDLGLSCRELERRMAFCGVEPGSIDAVLFTHDHSDHCCALEKFHSRHPHVPLFATDGTAGAIAMRTKVEDGWTAFETGGEFEIGDIAVETFSVPHDAADPVGYLFSRGDESLFVATDFGTVTEPVRQAFGRACCAVLESNHDSELLARSERPPALKQRIAGRSGHLSNDDAAELLRSVRPRRLGMLFLAHLSGECNEPRLAVRTVRAAAEAAGMRDLRIEPLSQDCTMCCEFAAGGEKT